MYLGYCVVFCCWCFFGLLCFGWIVYVVGDDGFVVWFGDLLWWCGILYVCVGVNVVSVGCSGFGIGFVCGGGDYLLFVVGGM